ncbi:hypothetical protein MRX96_030433 [Rhipicephalus microplus]
MPLNHAAQAKDDIIESLHEDNDQLKRCITEQRAEMQEMNAKLNQLVNAQKQQQTTPTTPPQTNPRPPTPMDNNTDFAMEVQALVTTDANSAKPEMTDTARTSEPAPKKSALDYARE